MAGNGIDKDADGCRVDEVRREFRPFRHGAGDDGGGGGAEYGVKDHESADGESVQHTIRIRQGIRIEETGSADDARNIFSKHERESQNEEKEGTENEIHHILHTDISRIFRPGEARFDHCKSRLHEINQKCAEHGPYNIH